MAVLDRQREVLGADHPHALMTAGSLAADHKALGDFREALEPDRRTYASFKEQFGEDYPRTLVAAYNLAISYRLNGDYAAARHLDQDTLDRRRVVLPPDHPYTLGTAEPGAGHAGGGRLQGFRCPAAQHPGQVPRGPR